LRLREGDAIALFSGNGGEYHATLVRVGKRDAFARIGAFVDVDRESPLAITLVQAIASSDTMDAILRHAVELGASRIAPVVTTRSARFPSGAQGDKRLAHWRQIAVAACEQSGRNKVPAIDAVLNFEQWLQQRDEQRAGLMLDPQAATDLQSLAAPQTGVDLVIGPEGGITDDEAARADRARIIRVRLGPRVLRTETASLAALTAINLLWGDLR